MFFRDNIDIDLDIENEISENIDNDIEPQFDIVPPLVCIFGFYHMGPLFSRSHHGSTGGKIQKN